MQVDRAIWNKIYFQYYAEACYGKVTEQQYFSNLFNILMGLESLEKENEEFR